MNELISLSQANHLMTIILIVAPVIGIVWGFFAKQLVRGAIYGVVIGVGNFILWEVYNAITNTLGLDTVKNLVVNLVLFIIIGVIAGIVIGRFDKGQSQKNDTKSVD